MIESNIGFRNVDIDKLLVRKGSLVDNLISSSFNINNSQNNQDSFKRRQSVNFSLSRKFSKLEFKENLQIKKTDNNQRIANNSTSVNVNLNNNYNLSKNNTDFRTEFLKKYTTDKENMRMEKNTRNNIQSPINNILGDISIIHGNSNLMNTSLSCYSNKNINSKQPMLFRRFSLKMQGKDENGNMINELTIFNNKDEILWKDLDNLDCPEDDKNLVDCLNVQGNNNNLENRSIEEEVHSDYCEDIDENLEERNQIQYEINFKGLTHKDDDVLDLKNIITKYYISDDLDTEIKHEKLDILKSQMNKLREKEEDIIYNKKYLEALKNKLNHETENFKKSLSDENNKIEKLSKLKFSDIKEYDKLKLLSKSFSKQKLETNKESYLDKYIEIEDNHTYLDKKTLQNEIESLKLNYENKSNKYKEIIRILKEKLSGKINN